MLYSDIGRNMNKARLAEAGRGSLHFKLNFRYCPPAGGLNI